MSKTERRLVPITERDRDELYEIRKSNQAIVGRLKMRKDRYVKRSKEISDKAESAVVKATFELTSGEREVDCIVRLDFHHGSAQIYRADTGEFVLSRPLTTEERQAPLPMDDYAYRGASETAKAKQPGLKSSVADVVEELRKSVADAAGKGMLVTFNGGHAPVTGIPAADPKAPPPSSFRDPAKQTVNPHHVPPKPPPPPLTDEERADAVLELGTEKPEILAWFEKLLQDGNTRAAAMDSAKRHHRMEEEAVRPAPKRARASGTAKVGGKGKKGVRTPDASDHKHAEARAIADVLRPEIGKALAERVAADLAHGDDEQTVLHRAKEAAATRRGLERDVLDELGAVEGSLDSLDDALYDGEELADALLTIRLANKKDAAHRAAAKERERLEAERDGAGKVATPTFPLDGDEPDDDAEAASGPVDRDAAASAAFASVVPTKAHKQRAKGGAR